MSNLQQRKQQMSVLDRLQRYLPQLVVVPPFLLIVFFVYGFIAWTGIISLTDSRMLPSFEVQGFQQYVRLFAMDRWDVAFHNLLIFGSLYILFAITIGCVLAVLLDQRIRAEGALRTIYLYPMAVSFIVTGTAWKWILNPSLGIESYMQKLGWESFQFDWIVNRDMAIYVVVIAAVWQASGFVMALFLSALRTVMKTSSAPPIWMVPAPRASILHHSASLRPVFLSAFVILAHLSIKSFDLVVALTNGGPGYSSTLPANFMYEMAFRRNQIGLGAASAMMMLATVAAIIVPYLYSELRAKRHG